MVEGSGSWILIKLVSAFLLVMANGFFVAAEYALVSVRRSRIHSRADQGDRRALAVLRLTENPAIFISETQFGQTLANIGLG